MSKESVVMDFWTRLARAWSWSKHASWSVTPTRFVLYVCLADILLYHLPLLVFSVRDLGGLSLVGLQTLGTLLAVIIIVTSTILFSLFLISGRLVKVLTITLAVTNSLALYFIVTYKVILSKAMMGNVQNTDFAEAAELFHPTLLVYILVLGVLPAWIVSRVRFEPYRRLRLGFHSLLIMLLGSVWIYSASNTWLWIDKHAKTVGGMILPWSYVFNTTRYYAGIARASETRAMLPDVSGLSEDKSVVVLVIGEAARAADFSLYGYHRETNVELARRNVLVLRNASSCATYTTAAIECMLTDANHESLFSQSYETLPSYLQRNGVDVIWRSNNWGEPPIQVNEYLRADDLKGNCKGEECNYDGVLLSGLLQRIKSSDSRKILVILHLKGSHGPSYHDRYPPRFEKFSPVCKSVDLQRCPPSGLINAYDNTILYTDHVLGAIIDMLKGLDDTSSAMIYMSDHGESLGEHGLYLHGTPYSIAPDVQKDIPFIIWMSPDFQRTRAMTTKTFPVRSGYSQANIFHSVLGALGVSSPAYDPGLDVFSTSAGVEERSAKNTVADPIQPADP